MYLSENMKKSLQLIIELWKEFGHAPSFKEFDDDPRTPRANSLSYEFGSYSAAVEKARPYLNHPELFAPRGDIATRLPQKTTSTLAQDKGKKSKKKKATTVTSTTDIVTPIATTPKPKLSPAKQYEVSWKQTAPAKPPEAKKPAEKAPEPVPKPVKTAPEAPKATETPTVPPAGTKAPDVSIMALQQARVNSNRPLLVNYLCKKIALISSDQYLAYSYGEPTEQFSYMIIQRSDFIAKTETKTIPHRISSYRAVSEYITFDIPIMRVVKQPIICKNGFDNEFPTPKIDTLLIVPYEVAVAARDCGRTTDDLIFPATYYEQEGICFCCEFGQI